LPRLKLFWQDLQLGKRHQLPVFRLSLPHSGQKRPKLSSSEFWQAGHLGTGSDLTMIPAIKKQEDKIQNIDLDVKKAATRIIKNKIDILLMDRCFFRH
jgi:hypothetical protein